MDCRKGRKSGLSVFVAQTLRRECFDDWRPAGPFLRFLSLAKLQQMLRRSTPSKLYDMYLYVLCTY